MNQGLYQRGAKIGRQTERSNTRQSGKIELEFHSATFLKVIGREVSEDGFIKFEVALADLTVWMYNEFGSLKVDGIYPHEDLGSLEFLFEIAMYDI